MRTTVTIDDDKAQAIKEISRTKTFKQIIDEALTSYLSAKASQELIKWGGSDMCAEAPDRRDPWEDQA